MTSDESESVCPRCRRVNSLESTDHGKTRKEDETLFTVHDVICVECSLMYHDVRPRE